jgi:hypothetical protein
MLNLAILYTPPGGRPLRLVNVADRRLLIAVAQAAILEATKRADRVAHADTLLGEVEAAEVSRVQRILSLFIPELSEGATEGAVKPC